MAKKVADQKPAMGVVLMVVAVFFGYATIVALASDVSVAWKVVCGVAFAAALIGGIRLLRS